MKFLQITPQTTLSDLADMVGEKNVDYVLNANGLKRTVNIGSQVFGRDTEGSTDGQTKSNILNTLVANSDAYEKAALGTEADWVSLYKYGTFSDCLLIPDGITLPLSDNVIGNGEPVSTELYNKINTWLKTNSEVDPTFFAEYSVVASGAYGSTNSGMIRPDPYPWEWFTLPWGKISLYSSISGEMVDFPVYPEEISDGYTANYDEMPQMIYQYEPWQVYKSSGPRTNSYTFHMHRDMWTGDHRDGLANDLVRFCEANCFPEYSGSAVHAPLVTFYLNSQNLITGVMKDCKADWTGPLGLDGFQLELKLTITITEVSPEPLNYTTVRNKGLIE